MNQSNIGFIFPGQGAQHLGMLSELAHVHPVIEEVFSQASEYLGYDLWALAQEGPEEKLNETQVTQPILLTASYALWTLWQANDGVEPAWMAGHSLGEYSALLCAGALDFKSALELVSTRGRLMQEAVPKGQGAMAAILGLENEAIQQACVSIEATSGVVSAVNFNAKGQTVIAGQAQAVEEAMTALKALGAKKVIPLAVSVPSHCALMKPAAEQLSAYLKEVPIQTPRISVLHNVDVSTQSDPSAIKQRLVAQLYQPVRWVETIESLYQKGIDHLYECGPSNVLSGLNKRIEKRMKVVALNTPLHFPSNVV